MPDISLFIVRAGDPPPWRDIADGGAGFVHAGTSWQVAVLEHGMTSGLPSVALRLDLPGPAGAIIAETLDPPAGGRIVIVETSLAAWITATAGMRGAFPASFADGPLHA